MSTVTIPEPPFVDPDHYEVVDGVRVELPPMGARETSIAGLLTVHLGYFALARRLGQVQPEMLFLIDARRNLQRRPDVSFVSADKWPIDRQAPTESAWALVPDLAVEVVSESNSGPAIQRKIREYFRAGVVQVWVVYPEEEQVFVYETRTRIRVVDRDETLTGDPVVPGFALPLAEIFLAP